MNIIYLIKKTIQKRQLMDYIDKEITHSVVNRCHTRAARYAEKLDRVRRIRIWATKKKR